MQWITEHLTNVEQGILLPDYYYYYETLVIGKTSTTPIDQYKMINHKRNNIVMVRPRMVQLYTFWWIRFHLEVIVYPGSDLHNEETSSG